MGTGMDEFNRRTTRFAAENYDCKRARKENWFGAVPFIGIRI